MRINKATLSRKWLVSTLLAVAAFSVMVTLDARLKALSGASTADLQGFTMGAQFEAAFRAWGVKAYLSRAGFLLGFDYLFMPLYATALFYSGVIVADAFSLAGTGLRRVLSMAALAPVLGAGLDAVENALQLAMLWGGPGDGLAQTAHSVSTVKWVGVGIGLLLLVGALFARVMERQRARLRRG